MDGSDSYTAFSGGRLVGSGCGAEVAALASEAVSGGSPVLIFHDRTGRQVELDPFRDPPALALPQTARAAPPSARAGRGRPRLGVVAREVTLLPRHWDWLAGQPGGASAALRRLVDDARRSSAGADEARQAQQAVYSTMSALAGDLPEFEEAARALYTADDSRFDRIVGAWPPAVADYITRLANVERAARLA